MSPYPYLDPKLAADERVADLVPRLSIEQKAGLMFHPPLFARPLDTKEDLLDLPTGEQLLQMGVNHFNLSGTFETPRAYGEFVNKVQKIALAREWGIPVTLSSDPRHGFFENPQTAMAAGCLSQWPEHIGMAALGDEKRMEEYADVVRQEYTAIGLRAALHPQTDLATEYRWSRIDGSLGEDADLASRLCVAHIRGLHGPTYGVKSVQTCVKHFPGGGPQEHGYDPHFPWGSDQIYPGGQFEYHLKPFRAAVASGVRCVMPSYGKPVGTEYDEVAMAYNKRIITDLLRGQLGFEGTIVSDWVILADVPGDEDVGDIGKAKAWGVEHLSTEQRILRALEAGIDQFGGESCVDLLVKVIKDGLVPESRIDQSVRRILKDKFELGLFEHPFVDLDHAQATVGRPDFRAAGLRAQKDALTLLKNVSPAGVPLLPLTKGVKIYTEGFRKFPTTFGPVVTAPTDADVAIISLATPFEVVGKGKFAANFHHGPLEFSEATLQHIAELAKACPVVVQIKTDRPPVLGSLVDSASAIILSFGIAETALVEVLFGESSPKGEASVRSPQEH